MAQKPHSRTPNPSPSGRRRPGGGAAALTGLAFLLSGVAFYFLARDPRLLAAFTLAGQAPPEWTAPAWTLKPHFPPVRWFLASYPSLASTAGAVLLVSPLFDRAEHVRLCLGAAALQALGECAGLLSPWLTGPLRATFDAADLLAIALGAALAFILLRLTGGSHAQDTIRPAPHAVRGLHPGHELYPAQGPVPRAIPGLSVRARP